MKIVTASNGKKSIKISKKEWQDIGKKAGWRPKNERSNEGKINEVLQALRRMNINFDSSKNEAGETVLTINFGVEMCSRCGQKPAMDSYSTCEECHRKSISEAEIATGVQ